MIFLGGSYKHFFDFAYLATVLPRIHLLTEALLSEKVLQEFGDAGGEVPLPIKLFKPLHASLYGFPNLSCNRHCCGIGFS